MNKILRELFFFALSCLSFILVLQSLPEFEERAMDTGLDRELRIQKENHINGRRNFKAEEKSEFPGDMERGSGELSLGKKGNILPEKKMTEEKNTSSVISLRTGDGDYIDLNRATEEELCRLKGIGPKLAKKIIEYREKNGEFMSIYDLTNVSGIGLQKLSRIQNQ